MGLLRTIINVDSRGKITGQGVATHQSQLNILATLYSRLNLRKSAVQMSWNTIMETGGGGGGLTV